MPKDYLHEITIQKHVICKDYKTDKNHEKKKKQIFSNSGNAFLGGLKAKILPFAM